MQRVTDTVDRGGGVELGLTAGSAISKGSGLAQSAAA